MQTQEKHDEKCIEFRVKVLDAASKQAEDIIRKADEYRVQQLEAAKSLYNEDSYNKRKKQLKADRSHSISKAQQKNRKQLLQYREQLVNGMFDEIRNDILVFAKSDKYEGYLVAALEKCLKLAGDTAENVVVYLAQKDMQYAAVLEKISAGYKIEADKHIHLGGLKVAFGKKVFNETLDDALAQEQKRFLTYCGLLV